MVLESFFGCLEDFWRFFGSCFFPLSFKRFLGGFLEVDFFFEVLRGFWEVFSVSFGEVFEGLPCGSCNLPVIFVCKKRSVPG